MEDKTDILIQLEAFYKSYGMKVINVGSPQFSYKGEDFMVYTTRCSKSWKIDVEEDIQDMKLDGTKTVFLYSAEFVTLTSGEDLDKFLVFRSTTK